MKFSGKVCFLSSWNCACGVDSCFGSLEPDPTGYEEIFRRRVLEMMDNMMQEILDLKRGQQRLPEVQEEVKEEASH